MKRYLPDFIVLIDDGAEDPLHLVVEIKGYRGEDAKEKKATMENYWVPGVNNVKKYGRWDFVELTDVFEMEVDFSTRLEAMFSSKASKDVYDSSIM
jgi:type III restriction enzyme